MLSPISIEGNICILCSQKHALRLGYRDGAWTLYDPSELPIVEIYITKEKGEMIEDHRLAFSVRLK